MINIQNVCQYFGAFPALKDISLKIAKGEIVGVLGQNGAGKTTLMRILTTYLRPSSGRVTVDGHDTFKDSLAVRREIGYLPETPPLYTAMSVWDYLILCAQLREIPRSHQRRKIEQVLEQCSLRDVRRQRIATLSKGFKQRLGIAQAILHDPKIVILDEPTNGLDPVQILQVRSLIKQLGEHQRTVILSTHILSEIETIAHRVIIIHAGEIVADHALEVLLKETQEKTLEKAFLKIVRSRSVLRYTQDASKDAQA